MAKTTEFGKQIKKRLVDLDMTQTELGNQVGCGRKYIVKILTGERSGERYMEELCRILGMPYTGCNPDDTAKGA